MKRLAALVSVLALGFACAPKVNDPADVQAIKDLMDGYFKAAYAKDSAALQVVLTDKTVLLEPHMAPLVGTEANALVQLGIPTPDGSTLGAGARRTEGVTAGTACAQWPLTTGPSVGYRLRGDTGGEGAVSALLQVQPTFGRLEVGSDRVGRGEVASASVSSGFAIVADRIFVTRPVGC